MTFLRVSVAVAGDRSRLKMLSSLVTNAQDLSWPRALKRILNCVEMRTQTRQPRVATCEHNNTDIKAADRLLVLQILVRCEQHIEMWRSGAQQHAILEG